MKRIGAANWVALGAAVILALAFILLPLLSIPMEPESEDETVDVVNITAASIVAGTAEDVDFELPNLNLLTLSVLIGMIAAVTSLSPNITRTSRYVVLLAGILGIVAFGSLPVTETGSDVALAQVLSVGYWLGLLACVVMVLQTFIAGASDPFSDNMWQTLKNVRVTRTQLLAGALVVIGLATFVQGLTFDSDVSTVLTFTPSRFGVEEGAAEPDLIELDVPTKAFTLVIGGVFVAVGLMGVANLEDRQTLTTWLLVGAGVMIFPTLLVIAAADGRTSATSMITESFRTATPIAIGAMAGIWCERSGVINIAIEGMMLFGACIGFMTLFLLQDAYPEQTIEVHMVLAVGAAILAGGVVALLHAWLSITFATDQIVSGTVINILALGGTSFIRREVLLSNEGGLDRLPVTNIPVLHKLPAIGPLFSGQPIFYMMFVLIILTHIMLFYTRWGLRIRAVGENPQAADTLGIKVNRMRWTNVFIGGMIAGLAGAWFSLEAAGRFTDGMTDGKGFISLAAVIFGKWTPTGAFGGALLFGFSEALGFRFQIEGVSLPVQFLQMVPYLVTLIVLAGLVGRAIPPKAIGKPYKKEGG